MRSASRWVAAALLASCAGLACARAFTAAPRPEVAVLTAALLAEIPHFRDLPGLPVCIALDPGGARQTASREFVAGLKDTGRRLVRAAECEVGDTGAAETATGQQALYLVAGPVDWIRDDEVWVTTTHVKTRAQSVSKQYVVVFEDGQRWRALGTVWRGMPN